MYKATRNESLHQILKLAQRAFEGQHFQTAYHLLISGMYYADEIHDADYLGELAGLALEQYAWIKAYLSTSALLDWCDERENGQDCYRALIQDIYTRMISLETPHPTPLYEIGEFVPA